MDILGTQLLTLPYDTDERHDEFPNEFHDEFIRRMRFKNLCDDF